MSIFPRSAAWGASAPAAALLCLWPQPAPAQSGAAALPRIVVQAKRQQPARPPPARTQPAPAPATPPAEPVAAATGADIPSGAAGTPPGASLTVPTFAQAQREVERTPGAVQVVPAEAYRNMTPASTLKDALDYVAGVFVQPKWGEDARLSIRGSGLSRNFHLRSLQLYMDGIPINTADGYGDLQEIDPAAYRYVEVYKGANAMRYGANSLGGAINFVTPSGRDAPRLAGAMDFGSFGFFRLNGSTAGAFGPYDYFLTGTYQRQDGFRAHSEGESERASGNFGYQISPDIETRFYFNANHIRQRIPGAVTKDVALTSPQTPAAINVLNDWQRNIDSGRLANKTTLRLGDTTVELGLFGVHRHLMHPIFQWLDYRYYDYGAFARVIDDRVVGAFRNRFIGGVNVFNGVIDADQYANLPGATKGALLSRTRDRSGNLALYAEDSFYVLRDVALLAGAQFLHATRDRTVLFVDPANASTVPGRTQFDLLSPKAGVLWQVTPTWQAFANVSRSAEVPSFGEGSGFPAPTVPFFALKAQTATTYEVGTRGRAPDLHWDASLYRAEIRNELQCIYSAFGNCNVINADRTVHQGVEVAVGAAVLKGLLRPGEEPDRLWLNLSYTLNDFFFDRDATYGNNRLPGAPRHFLRAELLYKHPSGFYVGPNVEWVPQAYFVDSANTLTTEPYVIFGLKAGYEAKTWSVYVEARNLANRAYIASASVIDVANPALPLFEPGTGRAVFAGFRGKI